MLERKSHIWYDFSQGDNAVGRVILFVLDENKCANDLLYDSPHYPVFNISSDDLCWKATISIKNYVYSIGKILEYYGYNEILKYKDICKIKEQFFGDFVLDNSELFGLCEADPNQSGNETYDLNGNHRTFNETKEESVFPKCYFKMFWRTRNLKSPYEGNIDRFIPREIEGPIKKLKL